MQPQSPKQSARASYSPRLGASRRNGPQPLPNMQSKAIEREEERQRDAILLELSLAAQGLDSESFHHQTNSFRRSVMQMASQMVALQKDSEKTRQTQTAMITSVNGLTGQVQSLGHVLGLLSDVHTESIKAQMMELRVSNESLQRRCDDLKQDLELERAQVMALKGTLRATLARSRDQVEELRDEVRARIAAEAIDMQQLKKDLQYRCDAAAATVQVIQPTATANFDARLRNLQETVTNANKIVSGRFALLRAELDSIRVSDESEQAMSQHSNIPHVFRTALIEQFSVDELVTLLDTLSFEPGVVAALSTAVAARRKRAAAK